MESKTFRDLWAVLYIISTCDNNLATGMSMDVNGLYLPICIYPYAPIPSASSFGVGFGYLNTFSQDIWSYI